MTHRQFRDSNSVEWEVWEVTPAPVVQPLLDRRSRSRSPDDAPVPRSTAELLLPSAGMSKGWLLFESDGEKRRLVPIPDGWADLPVDALEQLCERAVPARRGGVSLPAAAHRDKS